MIINPMIPVMYRHTDLNGTIQDCNHLYANALGYSIDEVVGSSILDHATDQTRTELEKMFDDWKKTHATNISYKIQLKRRNGTVIDVVRTVRNTYVDDRVVGVGTEMREASEIKKIQDMYNIDSREGYEDPEILRRSVDYTGTIMDCSESYLKELGYGKDEIVGINLYEHTAPRSRGNMHANMENWRCGVSEDAKIWMLRKDGSEFPVYLVASDEINSNKVVIGRTVSLELIK